MDRYEREWPTAEALWRILDGVGEVRIFSEISSTNTEAKRIWREEAPTLPLLLVADRQSGGRGRLGRSFYSPAGSGLYCSILYEAEGSMEEAVRVTSFAAVAVMRAIRSLTGKQTAIKWVNDLYYEGKKVCGILCEGAGMLPSGRQGIVLGIGINWHPAAFPEELASIAGSLGEERIPRKDLLRAVWRELLPALQGKPLAWIEDYRAHSAVLGKPIQWKEGEILREGIAQGIEENGALRVRDPKGEEHLLRTGEITVRLSE